MKTTVRLTAVLAMAMSPACLLAQEAQEPAPSDDQVAAGSQVVFSEAQTDTNVDAGTVDSGASVEEIVSEGGQTATEAIEVMEDQAASQEEAAESGSVEQAAEDILPLLESENLPEAASQFLPDDSLLMDSPSYIPSYDEIISQSQKIVRSAVEPGLEIRQNVALRKARTKALADPDVRAALENARAQLYHAEKTEAWKAYYDLLYKKMESADRGLAEVIGKMKNEDYLRLRLPVATEDSRE